MTACGFCAMGRTDRCGHARPAPPPRVLGLDLSLTSTGVALPDGDHGGIRTRPSTPIERRLIDLRDGVLASSFDVHLVALEDLPTARMAGNGTAVAALGMAHGVVRVALAEAGVPVVLIQPASLKKYATGKGNAGKELVLVEAVKRLDYAGSSNDEADALWLRAMALDHYGHPVVTMPAAHRVALEAVDWPVLPVALSRAEQLAHVDNARRTLKEARRG